MTTLRQSDVDLVLSNSGRTHESTYTTHEKAPTSQVLLKALSLELDAVRATESGHKRLQAHFSAVKNYVKALEQVVAETAVTCSSLDEEVDVTRLVSLIGGKAVVNKLVKFSDELEN